jgi:L-fuculose-phosphate aldolase
LSFFPLPLEGGGSGWGSPARHCARHGQLVATGTIEAAAVLGVFIARAVRMQVLAQSIGKIKPIDPGHAHDYRLKLRAMAATLLLFKAGAKARARGVGLG